MPPHIQSPPVARLLGLATTTPPYLITQKEAKATAREVFGEEFVGVSKLYGTFDNAGIDSRYLCAPPEWYRRAHDLAERNRVYLDMAEKLLITAARQALDRAGLKPGDIDAVVTVSSTGIATPSLDARIGDRLGLSCHVERTPLFGLGCAGGVLGLGRAARLAVADPKSRILLLVVELCSLTFKTTDRSAANLVASALFADGAAAAVIGCDGDGPGLPLSGEHRWPDSLDIMGWRVEHDGLGVVFAQQIPTIVRLRMRDATLAFLERAGLGLHDIDAIIAHPGGAKVLIALQRALDLDAQDLDDARDALRSHGNMSAASVFFVLERALKRPGWRRGLATALGPGFCVGFTLIERHE